MPATVNWVDIQAFLAVVGVFFGVGAWVQSLWMKNQLMLMKGEIINHVDQNYMTGMTLDGKFTLVHRRIDKLESPPVVDKLEALRLSVAHLTKSLEEQQGP